MQDEMYNYALYITFMRILCKNGGKNMKVYDEIKNLLLNNLVETQIDIKNALNKKGLKITQSSISRNLKKIGAFKTIENGKVKYKLPPKNIPNNFNNFARFVKSMDYNEHLIVVKTYPGSANVVGEYIDNLNDDNILGTIAGDNTIFITPKNTTRIDELFNILKFKFDKKIKEQSDLSEEEKKILSKINSNQKP